jgi:hypothetical protein
MAIDSIKSKSYFLTRKASTIAFSIGYGCPRSRVKRSEKSNIFHNSLFYSYIIKYILEFLSDFPVKFNTNSISVSILNNS